MWSGAHPPAGGQPLSKEGLQLQFAHEAPPVDPTKKIQSHTVVLGWGLRRCLSHLLPDDTDAAGPRTTDHGTRCRPWPSGLPKAAPRPQHTSQHPAISLCLDLRLFITESLRAVRGPQAPWVLQTEQQVGRDDTRAPATLLASTEPPGPGGPPVDHTNRAALLSLQCMVRPEETDIRMMRSQI